MVRHFKANCKRLSYIHTRQILHNDKESNNTLLEKQMEWQWNPVIIDFRKARFISDPKTLVSDCFKSKIIQEPLPALPTDTATLMRVAK